MKDLIIGVVIAIVMGLLVGVVFGLVFTRMFEPRKPKLIEVCRHVPGGIEITWEKR